MSGFQSMRIIVIVLLASLAASCVSTPDGVATYHRLSSGQSDKSSTCPASDLTCGTLLSGGPDTAGAQTRRLTAANASETERPARADPEAPKTRTPVDFAALPAAVHEPTRRCGGPTGNTRFEGDVFQVLPNHREFVRGTVNWLVDGWRWDRATAENRSAERQLFFAFERHDICLANQPNAAGYGRQGCDAQLQRDISTYCAAIADGDGDRRYGLRGCRVRAAAVRVGIAVAGLFDRAPQFKAACEQYRGLAMPRDQFVVVRGADDHLYGVLLTLAPQSAGKDPALRLGVTKIAPATLPDALPDTQPDGPPKTRWLDIALPKDICAAVQPGSLGVLTMIGCGAVRPLQTPLGLFIARPAVLDLDGDKDQEVTLVAVSGAGDVEGENWRDVKPKDSVFRGLFVVPLNIAWEDAGAGPQELKAFAVGNAQKDWTQGEAEDVRRAVHDAVTLLDTGPLVGDFIDDRRARDQILFAAMPRLDPEISEPSGDRHFSSDPNLRLVLVEFADPGADRVRVSRFDVERDGWADWQANSERGDRNNADGACAGLGCNVELFRRTQYPPLVLQGNGEATDKLAVLVRGKFEDSSGTLLSYGPIEAKAPEASPASQEQPVKVFPDMDMVRAPDALLDRMAIGSACPSEDTEGRLDRHKDEKENENKSINNLAEYNAFRKSLNPTDQGPNWLACEPTRRFRPSLRSAAPPAQAIAASATAPDSPASATTPLSIDPERQPQGQQSPTGRAQSVGRRLHGWSRGLYPLMPHTEDGETFGYSVSLSNCDALVENRGACKNIGEPEVLRVARLALSPTGPTPDVDADARLPEIVDVFLSDSENRPKEGWGAKTKKETSEAGRWLQMPSYAGRFGPKNEPGVALLRLDSAGSKDHALRVLIVHRSEGAAGMPPVWRAQQLRCDGPKGRDDRYWAFDAGAAVARIENGRDRLVFPLQPRGALTADAGPPPRDAFSVHVVDLARCTPEETDDVWSITPRTIAPDARNKRAERWGVLDPVKQTASP